MKNRLLYLVLVSTAYVLSGCEQPDQSTAPSVTAEPEAAASMVASAEPVAVVAVEPLLKEVAPRPVIDAETQANRRRVLESMPQQVFIPGYQALATAVDGLQQAFATLCEQKDVASLDAAREQWYQAMTAWGQIEWVKFGPILRNDRHFRLQFWPDRRNLTEAAVNGQLGNPSATYDVASIGRKSAAVQGLPALEYLLFSDIIDPLVWVSSEVRQSRYCGLAQGITGFIMRESLAIIESWQPEGVYGKRFLSEQTDLIEGLGNLEIAPFDVMGNNLVAHMQYVLQQKLQQPLGSQIEFARPQTLEAWRSQTSLRWIRANIASILTIYQGGEGYGLADLLLEDSENQVLHEQILAQHQKTLDYIDGLSFTLYQASTDVAQREVIDGLITEFNALKRLISWDLPIALHVTIGFNGNDGD